MINTKKQIMTLTVIVLVLGLGIGALADRMVRKGRTSYRHWKGYPSETLMDRFTKELGLDTQQQELVTAILEEKRARIGQVRSEMMSRFAEIKASSREEIRAVLNPEQQEKFDEICREADKKMEEWKKKWKQRAK